MSAMASLGDPSGQGWQQVALFALAALLSLLIGIEREAQQKAAGIRTYTLVGIGSALFMLVSKFGFNDVLSAHVTLDPSRVAAQIVSGLGFIGGGLIFVRRDVVRGLTTAASVWLTAAVAATAASGLWLLAVLATAVYFVVLYAVKPLSQLATRLGGERVAVRIAYLDGHGLLRDIVNHATERGFVVHELTTVDTRGVAERAARDTERDSSNGNALPDRRRAVDVELVLAGRGSVLDLSDTLAELDGVLTVSAPARDSD